MLRIAPPLNPASSLWCNKYLVWLENTDICITHEVAVRYLRKVYIARFRLKLRADHHFTFVYSIHCVTIKSLSEYIIPPYEILRIEIPGCFAFTKTENVIGIEISQLFKRRPADLNIL